MGCPRAAGSFKLSRGAGRRPAHRVEFVLRAMSLRDPGGMEVNLALFRACTGLPFSSRWGAETSQTPRFSPGAPGSRRTEETVDPDPPHQEVFDAAPHPLRRVRVRARSRRRRRLRPRIRRPRDREGRGDRRGGRSGHHRVGRRREREREGRGQGHRRPADPGERTSPARSPSPAISRTSTPTSR